MNNKKKYYMRGLGFGIFITALILLLVHKSDKMTDQKAIQRVKDMGYTLTIEDEPEMDKKGIDLNSIKAKLTPGPDTSNEAEVPENEQSETNNN